MGNILSRIQEIAHKEGITIGALERTIGASKGVLSRAISNGTDIQSKWLVMLVANYPLYSTRWLLTGEGSMLRNSKNSEEPTIGDVPNVVPISPAEESIIYKMYKDEKEEKERLVKEKESKIDHLQSELRSKSEELAVLKALHSQSQDKEPESRSSMDKALELFSLEPSEASIKGYSPTSPPAKSSTKLSAGKI